jgi:hypothetical protein
MKPIFLTIFSSIALLLAQPALADSKSAKTSSNSSETATSEIPRQNLAPDGGAPGKALIAYFSALKARNWQALKALTPEDIRRMMEEDEADGAHLKMLAGMAKSAPPEINITEAWIEAEIVAHVRYQGRVADKAISGNAELVLEDGE